eukprot:3375226-Prymnesium_polylepis.1
MCATNQSEERAAAFCTVEPTGHSLTSGPGEQEDDGCGQSDDGPGCDVAAIVAARLQLDEMPR